MIAYRTRPTRDYDQEGEPPWRFRPGARDSYFLQFKNHSIVRDGHGHRLHASSPPDKSYGSFRGIELALYH
jgi:hypothetical protein